MSRNKYPEQTREQILDTATRLFLQQGYEHTTIQNIIDQLGGLTKGAVYHHFSSKEAILNAVAARIFENNSLSATWQKIAVSTTLTGSQKLTQMLLAAEVVALLANLWLSPLVFADGPEKRKQKLAFLCTLCEPTGLDLAPLQPYLDQL